MLRKTGIENNYLDKFVRIADYLRNKLFSVSQPIILYHI